MSVGVGIHFYCIFKRQFFGNACVCPWDRPPLRGDAENAKCGRITLEQGVIPDIGTQPRKIVATKKLPFKKCNKIKASRR